jgi:hypothetical protein
MAKRRGISGAIAGLPGIKGYKEKEDRREADKQLRTELARRLQTEHGRILEAQQELAARREYALVTEVDRAQAKLQLLIDRIRTASYGYSGFFDAVQVKEEQLDALIAFDEALAAQAGRVTEGVTALADAVKNKEGISEAVSSLVTLFNDLNNTFSQRAEAITGSQ